MQLTLEFKISTAFVSGSFYYSLLYVYLFIHEIKKGYKVFCGFKTILQIHTTIIYVLEVIRAVESRQVKMYKMHIVSVVRSKFKNFKIFYLWPYIFDACVKLFSYVDMK